jgi:hypothetical protein
LTALVCIVIGAAPSGSARSGNVEAVYAHPSATVAVPRVVYIEAGRTKEPRRIQGSIVAAKGVSIRISWPNLLRRVSWYVDQPDTSTQVYAVDASAPFELPRSGKGSKPYDAGAHTIRAVLELRTGRTIGLRVAYAVARALDVSSTIDASSLQAAIQAMPAGPVLVRPGPGQTSFAVTGGFQLSRQSVAIERATFADTIEFRPSASGSSLRSSSALGFFIFGADDILLQGNVFDGQGVRKDTIIWDEPAGNTPDGWVIRGNLFRNYYTSNPEDHSQAIYVGYSTNGLIEGNTFTNNGNTSHVFFTWFGNLADPTKSYPKNICVRGNTFGPTAGAYYDINYKAEIPLSSNIKVQRNASGGGPFYGRC